MPVRILEFSGVLFKSLRETTTDFALNFPTMEILLHGPNSIDFFFLFLKIILMGVKYVLHMKE